ncbi:MAG: hypothetical protein SF051_16270 [Elusimicrobiota bacterium]|nr:hypothetical protein [Elusimicrobiota bacterium]
MRSLLSRRDGRSGQVLAGVVMLLLLLMIIVPAMVKWVQEDTKMAVKDSKASHAFALAEAAVDRGMWKLKSTTTTWENAVSAIQIPGYQFDVTYNDVSSGTYRINFSSGLYAGVPVVMVWGEGRDEHRKETRSIQVVYQNTSAPGAIISGAALTESGQAISHWGPVMAWNNINRTGTAYNRHYPRALSKQSVLPYDTNGVTPPNTDNLEWWSSYDVPELPQFDFAAMKSSAQATNTYNCNGSWNSTGNNRVPCNTGCVTTCSVTNLYRDNRYNSNHIWYWDSANVTLNGTGVNGTVIIRGNATMLGSDYYGTNPAQTVNMRVPADAWIEYQKIDTTSKNQYPGDIGNRSSNNYYVLGTNSTAEGSPVGSDLGFKGFLYVGGNIDFSGGDADVHGAVWVVGNWNASGNTVVFYDDTLSLPMLNVVLVRKSWKEVSPSAKAWP